LRLLRNALIAEVTMSGPLTGLRVIEIAGLGAGPFCGMMLADMGAEVVRVERVGTQLSELDRCNPLLRSRRSIELDLKNSKDVDILLQLTDKADVLFESFRPGVVERLGFGPDICLQRNPRLVYGRLTGWGQQGPLAAAAGHDINYIALAGALSMIGERDRTPVPPLNLVGDFGGGGMLLAFGIVCALHEARASGKGQVIDAAMLDGTITLMSMFHGMRALDTCGERPGENLLSGAAHFYSTYETSDGCFISIAAIEPQFYALLIDKMDLDRNRFAHARHPNYTPDEIRTLWPALKQELACVFKSQTRAHWDALLLGTDACYAPALTLAEAATHSHNESRKNFIEVDGVTQNAPAPRFSRTEPEAPTAPRKPGADTEAVLADWSVVR
jgi:alpha-methylacyl-CoA racemase